MKTNRLVILGLVLVVAVAAVWTRRNQGEDMSGAVELRGPASALTIAATGDTLIGGRFTGLDARWASVSGVLQSASLAMTDLDQPLRGDGDPLPTAGRPAWPTGGWTLARALRELGFTIVTLANEHATDDRGEGADRSVALLTRAGLWTSGAGIDLDAARAPAIVGDAPRRVAVVDAAISVLPSGRASRSREGIRGRPGVNALRYSATVSADAATFAALSDVVNARAAAGEPSVATSGDVITLSGTTIRRGATTSVELVADAADLANIVADIRAARQHADVVVLSLHTHEPFNRSEAPPDFVRMLARSAIDAGAALVLGHGSRQLRGIEIYRAGAIFYGLGSFAFDRAAIAEGAGTIFDTDASAYDLALGAAQAESPAHLPSFAEPAWRESAIATATFSGAVLTSIALTPIELGVYASADGGLPRVAIGDRARAILSRLATLSAPLKTTIVINGDRGAILVAAPKVARNAVASSSTDSDQD